MSDAEKNDTTPDEEAAPRPRRRAGRATAEKAEGARTRRRPLAANPFAIEDGGAEDQAPEVPASVDAPEEDAVEADPTADEAAEDGAVEDGAVEDESAAVEAAPRPRRRSRGGRRRAAPDADAEAEAGAVEDAPEGDQEAAGEDADDAEDGQVDEAVSEEAVSEEAGSDEAGSEEAVSDEAGSDEAGSDEAGSEAGEGEAAPRRRRRRGRRGKGNKPPVDQEQQEDGEPDRVVEDGRGADDWEAEARGGSASAPTGVEDPDEDDQAADGSAVTDDGDEPGPAGATTESSGDPEDDESSSRRRRRGRRGRGRRTRPGSTEGKADDAKEGGGSSGEADGAQPTRLSARSQRAAPRRRVPTVSPETRRVIAESPPKRMLVTVGAERTQIAVLEERTLVEHYVTQASEASYVGNIYKARVQNVLPGMEAAFVDIGKGRNGVLYAGEVNYDEADRDGGLPRIEQVLKSGQTVLVQVTKDPMGTKGARLTQHLSLAGRYCVLAPGDDMLGISRKLPDDQRDRLRKILKELKPEGFGLIVRTAAETATAEQLQADVERLMERWAKVEEKAAEVKVLEPVYAEPQLVLRVIRDIFGPEHTQLVIDDAELAEQVRSYLADVSPEHVDKVITYDPPPGPDGTVQRLFDSYEVTNQIRRALEKKVWLRSGGYLIIEKTEAMWVIDVNTGKFVGKDNLEETVLRNNIEAAEEIARQLRLRDMGGIIVIDFVDMIVPANRDEVLKRFRHELARDKTKSRVMEISKLGLVQMTRKNVSKGLMESFTEETDDAIPGRRIVEDLLA